MHQIEKQNTEIILVPVTSISAQGSCEDSISENNWMGFEVENIHALQEDIFKMQCCIMSCNAAPCITIA